jgi:hypothetical protein
VKQLLTRDPNIADIYSYDEGLAPGKIQIGDISSDGFPEILFTLRYINGSTKSQILMNEPC